MELHSQSFPHEGRIPAEFAFGKADPKDHFTFAENRNPHFAWSGLPAGCRSLVMICVDPDAPTVGDDVNQEGRSVAADLPRANFYHWAMVDIPVTCNEIAAGSCSDGVTFGGKKLPPGPAGSRQAKTDYTAWFAGDPKMGGDYFGYDGPAPPWNDEREHHYHFTLYAVDWERCPLEGEFTVQEVEGALNGHVLGQATWTGTYTTNPALL